MDTSSFITLLLIYVESHTRAPSAWESSKKIIQILVCSALRNMGSSFHLLSELISVGLRPRPWIISFFPQLLANEQQSPQEVEDDGYTTHMLQGLPLGKFFENWKLKTQRCITMTVMKAPLNLSIFWILFNKDLVICSWWTANSIREMPVAPGHSLIG